MYGNPPELTLTNMHPKDLPYPGIFNNLLWCFIWISCNPSPIIARTIRNEKDGRKIFYGMMIVEGVIAMIWAAAAMSLMNGEDLSVYLQMKGFQE
jgi:hypothetical protein